jgi:hypothetical protein
MDHANRKKSMKQTLHDLMTTARMRAKQAAVKIRKRPRAVATTEQH